jgi:diguanylate cyclase (GGDEF)-like protein
MRPSARVPWPIAGVVILAAIIMTVGAVWIERDRRIDELQVSTQREVDSMATLAREAISRRHYQLIEELVHALGRDRPDIVELRIETPGDFVLADYRRSESAREPISASGTYGFGYEGFFEVALLRDAADIDSSLTRYALGIATIAFLLALLVFQTVYLFSRQQERRWLERLANRDGLTGLANRRRFNEILEIEWKRASRSGEPLTLLLLDVDHFKDYNDTYGHLAGDEVLKALASVLLDTTHRAADFVARFGGEEFAVLLPSTDLHGAKRIAKELRSRVRNLEIPHRGSLTHEHVTICVGVAGARPGPEHEVLTLVRRADEALNRAKQNGRDCVGVNAAHAGLQHIASLTACSSA